MLCLYWFKKDIDVHTLDELAGIYKATMFWRSTAQYFKHVITNHEVKVMIWKDAPMTKKYLLLFC